MKQEIGSWIYKKHFLTEEKITAQNITQLNHPKIFLLFLFTYFIPPLPDSLPAPNHHFHTQCPLSLSIFSVLPTPPSSLLSSCHLLHSAPSLLPLLTQAQLSFRLHILLHPATAQALRAGSSQNHGILSEVCPSPTPIPVMDVTVKFRPVTLKLTFNYFLTLLH